MKWPASEHPPQDFIWHKRELNFPVRLIDGGMATEIALRRWNGQQWEYRQHTDDADRRSDEAW